MISLYQSHRQRWKDCTRCHLHKVRNNVVLARGRVPCDVLFVGEGPGDSEDVVGKPFWGPAGRILDSVITHALSDKFTHAVTNLVACIPRDETTWEKVGKPDDESVTACAPRLQEFVTIADPKLLVLVGEDARDWLTPGYKHSIKLHKFIPQVHIVHPAWILRQNVAQRNHHVRRCIIAVSNAVQDLDALAAKQKRSSYTEDDIPY